MTRMHNPPHPGEVLREYLGDITITEAAVKLGVNRVTLSRVVTGASGISADMAYRLAQAFGKRSIISYISSPITKTLNSAFTEK